MRLLRNIALILGLWAVLATVYFQFLYKGTLFTPRLPRSPALIELETRKAQRYQDTATFAFATSLACFGVDSIIRILRRPRFSKSADRD
jgi:hypothetical protein